MSDTAWLAFLVAATVAVTGLLIVASLLLKEISDRHRACEARDAAIKAQLAASRAHASAAEAVEASRAARVRTEELRRSQLKIIAVVMQRIASLTSSPDDARAAETAEAEYRDHLARQVGMGD